MLALVVPVKLEVAVQVASDYRSVIGCKRRGSFESYLILMWFRFMYALMHS